MKKTLIMILAIVMSLFLLSSCTQNAQGGDVASEKPTEDQPGVEDESDDNETQAPTEEPTEGSSGDEGESDTEHVATEDGSDTDTPDESDTSETDETESETSAESPGEKPTDSPDEIDTESGYDENQGEWDVVQ